MKIMNKSRFKEKAAARILIKDKAAATTIQKELNNPLQFHGKNFTAQAFLR